MTLVDELCQVITDIDPRVLLDLENVGELLLYFVAQNNADRVDYLLRSGVDVHYRNDEALTLAAFNGYTNIARNLLEYGASRKESALEWAVSKGHLPIVELLIREYNTTINSSSLGQAVINGYEDIVDILLERGVKKEGLLVSAATFGYARVIEVLLSYDINDDIEEALKIAVQTERRDIVELLIDYGAFVDYDLMDHGNDERINVMLYKKLSPYGYYCFYIKKIVYITSIVTLILILILLAMVVFFLLGASFVY